MKPNATTILRSTTLKFIAQQGFLQMDETQTIN